MTTTNLISQEILAQERAEVRIAALEAAAVESAKKGAAADEAALDDEFECICGMYDAPEGDGDAAEDWCPRHSKKDEYRRVGFLGLRAKAAAAAIKSRPRVITEVRISGLSPSSLAPPSKAEVKYDTCNEWHLLFDFYHHEISFTEEELVGLTKAEALELKVRRDALFIRS
jgi:hypothetical protein